ncbi:complement factor B-like [Rhincodon typus]|uniref:complement factor B-like n=1 Tax=Rhincodon typus TaxID=259920 RepID=UPI0009A29C0B|nr:complement factor B-like [Rhincodon typus]
MKLYGFLIFCLAFLAGAQGDDDQEENITCDPNVHIIGGTLTKSNGNALDSVLKFQCPESTYPFPVSHTKCMRSGHWFRSYHRRHKPTCKEFRCPMPVLEGGMFRPLSVSYAIGETVTFECYDGYMLQGSVSRTCLKNGRWNGTMTSCNSGSQHCPHPGIPAGGRKSGSTYVIGSKVEYACNDGLVLVGSNIRQCLESREWSGREPSCQHKSSFDTPEDVASAFTASFTSMLGLTQTGEGKQPASTARKIILAKDTPLHIYILLDASESVGEANFEKAKNVIKNLIDKIASFDVRPKFGVVSYASEPITISNINIQETANADDVIYQLENAEEAKYGVHADKRGTNIHAAFKKVMEMMVLSKIIYKNSWDETRFVTILFTDGKSNMGGDPRTAVKEIKDFVIAQNKSLIDYLDMYSFGVSDDAKKPELNALSSQKHDEQHCFTVKNTLDLIKAFDNILDLTQIGDLCGVADENLEKSFRRRHPWHVLMEIPGIGSCSGAIVSPQWVLTAAHCLKDVQTKLDIEKITVQVGDKFRLNRVEQVYPHPQYNLSGLLDEKISQFYDYDVALLKLKKTINFSETNSRSICLPCTRETTRAIRKPFPGTSCRDHDRELLPKTMPVPAIFVKRDKRLESEAIVKIKTSDALRDACEANALHAEEYKHVTDVRKVVTDRFLCTGGQEPTAEEVSCKGDSGGALYVEKKRRFIQVGVVSWGVINVCDTVNPDKRHARDFHLNLFKVLPWLKERLGKVMTFID